MIRIPLLLGLLFLSSPPLDAQAIQIFVSPSGNDATGDGTVGNPYRSITRALQDPAVASGTVLEIAAGAYDDTVETFPITLPAGITLNAPAAGTTTVDATGVPGVDDFVIGPPALRGLALQDPVTLNNLTVTGSRYLVQADPAGVVLNLNSCDFVGGMDSVATEGASGFGKYTFSKTTFQGYDFGLRVQYDFIETGQTLDVDIDGCTFDGGGTAMEGISLDLKNGMGHFTLDMSTIRGNDIGVYADIASDSSDSTLGGQIADNDFISNLTGAVWLGSSSSSSAVESVNSVKVQYNQFSSNGVGLRLMTDPAGGPAGLSSWVMGNFFNNNSTGVQVEETAAPSSIPNLGDDTTLGRNAFRINAGFDIDYRGDFGISARWNWHDSDDPVLVEDKINHNGEKGAGTGVVDFMPLSNTLKAKVTPSKVRPGQTVTVTAEPGSAFVPNMGSLFILLTFANLTIFPSEVLFGPNGRWIRFPLPLFAAEFSEENLLIQLSFGLAAHYTLAILLAGEGGRGSCFVATAAYGNNRAPEVLLLRQWRDESLSGNPLGRALVRTYYRLSPPLAEAVAPRPWARAASRLLLAPVVGAVHLWLDARWVWGLAGLALGFQLLRRRVA
ncbi:MAG: CFI-box-CTERM domain-containing protein [Planctomycetota bacterium]